MRFISRQRATARKWSFLIGVTCVLSACFTGVGGLHKPTKYDGIWRTSITSSDCISFESEIQVLGGFFAVKTRDLPAIFRKKYGSIRGVIRDGRISTAAGILRGISRAASKPESERPIITQNSRAVTSNIPIAQLEMVFSSRRNGSGTFQTPECSGTIMAQYVRRHF